MTTNQTIDGVLVPRELLKRLLNAAEWQKMDFVRSNSTFKAEITNTVDELRALLDAPINPLSELEVLRAAVKELEAMRDARVDAKLAQPQGETVRDDSETLSYKLEYLGPISRCDVACGSYGDKFHRWDDAGPYVEYEDHLKYIEAYKGEIDYLKNISANAEQPAPVAVVLPPQQCRQRIASEGKPYPRSSCAVCGQFSPKSRECDALIEATRLNAKE